MVSSRYFYRAIDRVKKVFLIFREREGERKRESERDRVQQLSI